MGRHLLMNHLLLRTAIAVIDSPLVGFRGTTAPPLTLSFHQSWASKLTGAKPSGDCFWVVVGDIAQLVEAVQYSQSLHHALPFAQKLDSPLDRSLFAYSGSGQKVYYCVTVHHAARYCGWDGR